MGDMEGLREERAAQNRRLANLRREVRLRSDPFDLPDVKFVKNFRLSKMCVLGLYTEIEVFLDEGRYGGVTRMNKLLTTLNVFAHGSYQRGVGNSFHLGLAQTTVSKVVREVTNVLNMPQIADNHIVFPQNAVEKERIVRGFYEKFNVPGVLGCIDCTHVAMIRPTEHEERFYSRKGFHSRNVQIICDCNLIIMNVDPSYGGAAHDSFVWRYHELHDYMQELYNNGECIWFFGDQGYAQRPWLMTPILHALPGTPEKHYYDKHCENASNDCGMSDEKWDLKKFKKRFRVVIVRLDSTEMEFDLIGIQPAFANAFRRLMLSEVPSMAIEKVMIKNNTSIIQDEVLAHRLGLIPLKADPRLFEYRPEESTEGTEFDTLEFSLKVKCSNNPAQPKDSYRPEDLYENNSVYSSQIKWNPIGNQASVHKESSVGPVHSDILIAKMRPGHEMDLHMIAVKGIGRDHAKFSPVATASYRLLPEVRLTREVSGGEAALLQSCFSPGVIALDAEGRARVREARYDTCSRNVFRYDEIKDAVLMSRVRDHFIFNVESVGAMAPNIIFVEAVKVLRDKCKSLLHELTSF